MLHIVNKSPFERNALDSCLRFGRDGSAVLLIEDGVYAATRGNVAEPKIKAALGQIGWRARLGQSVANQFQFGVESRQILFLKMLLDQSADQIADHEQHRSRCR